MGITRWGLIGCGDIAKKRIAPALRDLENCDLVAVNRQNYDLAEAFAKEFGAQKWYKDWQELLKDDEIDAVYIATPVYLHAEQTIAAAKAGKHVLCEKPMAMNAAECQAMIDACETNGVKLGVAYYRHFYPVVDRIKEIVNSGEIGDPVVTQINVFEVFDRKPGEARYWLTQKDMAGGGPIMDVGSHRIELLLNVFGEIKKATGFANNVVLDRDVEDTGVVQFEFESSIVGVLTVCHAAIEPQDTFKIFGTKGTIYVSVLNNGDLTVKTKKGVRTETLPPHTNVHQPHIDAFVKSIQGNDPVIVDGIAGKRVSEIEDEIFGR